MSKFSSRCEGEYKDPSDELGDVGGGQVMEAPAATRHPVLIAEPLSGSRSATGVSHLLERQQLGHSSLGAQSLVPAAVS